MNLPHLQCVTAPPFLCFALCWQFKDFFSVFFSPSANSTRLFIHLFLAFFFFFSSCQSGLFLFFLVAGLLILSLKWRFIGEEEDCCFTGFFPSVTWNRNFEFRRTSTWKRNYSNINTTKKHVIRNDCLYQKKRWFKNWLIFYRKY